MFLNNVKVHMLRFQFLACDYYTWLKLNIITSFFPLFILLLLLVLCDLWSENFFDGDNKSWLVLINYTNYMLPIWLKQSNGFGLFFSMYFGEHATLKRNVFTDWIQRRILQYLCSLCDSLESVSQTVIYVAAFLNRSVFHLRGFFLFFFLDSESIYTLLSSNIKCKILLS